jgi:YfiH family protein
MQSDVAITVKEGSPELRTAANGVPYLAVPEWKRFDWLLHGFSTRRGGTSRAYLSGADEAGAGELNLGFTAADSEVAVLENRALFREAVSGSRATPLISMRQCHSNRSVVADAALVGSAAATHGRASIQDIDGLLTAEPGVLLGVQTADCIPVLMADTKKHAVAGFHAGWRGTVERIVELGVARMREEFGSEPGDLVAAIGPGIGQCCYIVGGEVRERFGANFAYADELFSEAGPGGQADTLRLDLIEANRRQLMAAGVSADAISMVGGCTACHPEWYYSHRASGGRAGRMMAVIGVR